METPKPHLHSELIKAWADGATIQQKNYNGEWEDCRFNLPPWNEKAEYRIKPSNEPWKPKENELIYYVNQICEVSNFFWSDEAKCCKLMRDAGNCFRTREEAEAAIPRVKAALKGTTDVSGNVGSNVGSEIDGKPLTDGEVALIKALREYPLTQVHGADGKSILIHTGISGYMQTKTTHISIWSDTSSESCDENVKDALKQIKSEQEAGNANH